MALLTKAPRGTQDLLPKDSGKLQFVEGSLLGHGQAVWISGNPHPGV